MERLEFALFPWFVGLGIYDPAWDHSVFSKNRDRLLEGEIAAKFLAAILTKPRVMRLLWSRGRCARCSLRSTIGAFSSRRDDRFLLALSLLVPMCRLSQEHIPCFGAYRDAVSNHL
jgi:transposase-like protein DUF772